MAYQIHDIVLYKFPLNEVDYPRPCIIVDIAPNGLLGILPISTKHYSGPQTFLVSKDAPEFSLTGLTETSYIFGDPVLETQPDRIIKLLGKLSGDLKTSFVRWIG